MRDHWWWRPGWRVGRSYYTWHLTFEDADEVHGLAARYAGALAVPGLDLVPPRWLHLTVQGVGFTDEVTDLDPIVEAVRRRVADLPAFEVVLEPPVVETEVVVLPVSPPEPMVSLRAAIRAGMADVRGAAGVPGTDEGFHPHVSLAYSNADGPADPIRRATTSVPAAPTRTTIRAAHLIALNRDHHEYRWSSHATAPLA